MATKGQIKVAVTAYDDLIFDWSRTSVSEANNTSTIAWKLLLRSVTNGDIISSATKYWNVTIDGEYYGGSNSVAIGQNETKTLASGTTTITHNYDGTKTCAVSFSQTFGITFAGKAIGTIKKEASITLDPIQRAASIISAADFTDEGNPSFTYTPLTAGSVARLECHIYWDGVASLGALDVPVTGSSYTFSLSNNGRGTLRKAMANKNTMTVTYELKTVFKDGTFRTSTKNATAKIVNAYPTVQATIVDDADNTTDITGNENVLVKGESVALCTATATALKGASIVSVEWRNGTKSQTGASTRFPNVESNKFEVIVTDSRGNKAQETLTKTMIDYIQTTCNLDNVNASADGNISAVVSGNFFNGSFGTLTNRLWIGYKLFEKGAKEPSWVIIYPTTSGNTFMERLEFDGLDYMKTYTLMVHAGDSVNTSRTITTDISVLPVFDWGKNDFQFNVPVNFGAGAQLKGNAIDAGEWTPTLTTAAAVTSYEVQEGWWQRVGKVVTIGWQIKATCKSGYQTTALSIGGVPFTPNVAAFGGGVAFNIYITGGFCFEGWAIDTLGSISPRLQPCNNTSAANLQIASTAYYPTGGAQVTLAGTVCFITDD